MAKLVPGENDLATLFPEVAKQADGWDPSSVSRGSAKSKKWKCLHGHVYTARVRDRTPPNNQGCPYCSGKRVLSGVNDLATLFPELAEQALGWNPKEVRPGSEKKYQWKCAEGHTWLAKVCDRTTPAKRTGCPYCSGRKAVLGVNDLATLFPEVAKEADGWDPVGVKPGSDKNQPWRCELGHRWKAQVNSRTPPRSTGCPYCSGLRVVSGATDLATLFPKVALLADGWDPKAVTAKNRQKKKWRCVQGHQWEAQVGDLTRGGDCPYCRNHKVLPGFNDLERAFPELAKEAFGWDAKYVLPGSGKKLKWQCRLGHTWLASPVSRTSTKTGCPYCAGFTVLKGFNDLATVNPELAKEADGWDPSTVTPGSDKVRQWRCNEGHTWKTKVSTRSKGKGCPDCAKPGFKPGLEAWFYLLERPGEQQFGVTNELDVRLAAHARYGWLVVEVTGPHPGKTVLATEAKLKRWLKKEVGLVPGKHENWLTTKLEVRSLAELKQKSGVETELF